MKTKLLVLVIGLLIVLQMTGCSTMLQAASEHGGNTTGVLRHTPEPEGKPGAIPTPDPAYANKPAAGESTAVEEVIEESASPEPSAEPVDEVKAWAESIAAAASENSGIPLELGLESSGEKMALYSYSAPDGTTLSISYDVELDKPEKISVSLGALEPTEEWIALKDGVLSIDFIGLEPEKISKYFGDCGFGYGSPEDAGKNGITVLVGQVNSCVMMIQWIDD